MTREKEAWLLELRASSLFGGSLLFLSAVGEGSRVLGSLSKKKMPPPTSTHISREAVCPHSKLGYVKVQVDIVPTSLVLRDRSLHAS